MKLRETVIKVLGRVLDRVLEENLQEVLESVFEEALEARLLSVLEIEAAPKAEAKAKAAKAKAEAKAKAAKAKAEAKAPEKAASKAEPEKAGVRVRRIGKAVTMSLEEALDMADRALKKYERTYTRKGKDWYSILMRRIRCVKEIAESIGVDPARTVLDGLRLVQVNPAKYVQGSYKVLARDLGLPVPVQESNP